MDVKVSVIIPVFNCERYIEKAIHSALCQPEVIEIVVVNDGSTDGTEEILDKLRLENPIIKIYFHENKANKGRSASRNLGIKKATGNFLAFLDADDFYLNNRFKNDLKIFQDNKCVDGVYNAIGVHFYREASKSEVDLLKLTTINKKIDSKLLFEALLSGKHGHFSIDGLTVKKSMFEKIGYFSEELKVAEDTEIFFRMALKCRLESGVINRPLAMRGIHDNNISNKESIYEIYRVSMFESLLFWGSKTQVPLKILEKFLDWIWINRYKQKNSLMKDIFYWVFLTFNSPKILFSYITIKYFPLVRLRKKFFPFLYKY